MWPARGKHTPMPPKAWLTSYLVKIRHDLTHSGRLPTCKQHNPQAVIHHTTCTQSISIINYIFIHIILKCIQRYQLSIEFLYDIWYNNTTHDKINNTWRPRWQYTDPPQETGLMSKVIRAHHWIDVSKSQGAAEGPGRSKSVKETAKQWVKYSVSKCNTWKS